MKVVAPRTLGPLALAASDRYPKNGLIKMFTDYVGDPEEGAMRQLRETSSMPFIHKHLAVMPDVHWGMGSTVGSVVATRGAIIPATVGVDIGCGVAARMTGLTANDLPDSLGDLRSGIECAVPHGRTNDGKPGDVGAWTTVPDHVRTRFGKELLPIYTRISERTNLRARALQTHLGTLGSGNHFIELCLDEADRVWVMLHSGSRGIGNRIGQTFIKLAQADAARWFVHLPNKDLAYFPEGTDHFDAYVEAVSWAQDFARINREIMMEAVLKVLKNHFAHDWSKWYRLQKTQGIEAVNCHHNYVARENHFGANVLVTRKGAVRARQGDLGIIPGSMGERSFIVRGKGNADSFNSCSHGAGRVMSRGAAKRTFTVEDLAAQTEGVECRKDASVIDEIPAAYKNLDDVMRSQEDLVEIVHTLKQFLVVKG